MPSGHASSWSYWGADMATRPWFPHRCGAGRPQQKKSDAPPRQPPLPPTEVKPRDCRGAELRAPLRGAKGALRGAVGLQCAQSGVASRAEPWVRSRGAELRAAVLGVVGWVARGAMGGSRGARRVASRAEPWVGSRGAESRAAVLGVVGGVARGAVGGVASGGWGRARSGGCAAWCAGDMRVERPVALRGGEQCAAMYRVSLCNSAFGASRGGPPRSRVASETPRST